MNDLCRICPHPLFPWFFIFLLFYFFKTNFFPNFSSLAFDVLYMQMGNRVLDGILQPLIRNLEDSDPEVSRMALNALKQILAVRSNIVLPFVVPKLVNPPLTLFNAKSLAAVAEVSGNALNGYFATILPAMFEGMFETGTLAVHDEEIIKAASRIVLATGEEGCSILFGVLLELIKSSDNKKYKLGACQVIGSFAKESKVNFSAQIPVCFF